MHTGPPVADIAIVKPAIALNATATLYAFPSPGAGQYSSL
jgi:hypothetical protein